MKKISIISLIATAIIVTAISCSSDVKRTPGNDYMPDMRFSRAYETYSVNPVFGDNQTNRKPVK